MAPPKGKAPTKGARQILEDNKKTVDFYRTMSITAFVIHMSVMLLFYSGMIDVSCVVLNVFMGLLYFASHQAMQYMSRPKYNDNNQLIDAGLDLNMEGAMGEHFKDVVILCSITHIATILSGYFWFLLLGLPIRAFWLLWVNFLGPWFFQRAPEENPEQEEKKKKKNERKMKRTQ